MSLSYAYTNMRLAICELVKGTDSIQNRIADAYYFSSKAQLWEHSLEVKTISEQIEAVMEDRRDNLSTEDAVRMAEQFFDIFRLVSKHYASELAGVDVEELGMML